MYRIGQIPGVGWTVEAMVNGKLHQFGQYATARAAEREAERLNAEESHRADRVNETVRSTLWEGQITGRATGDLYGEVSESIITVCEGFIHAQYPVTPNLYRRNLATVSEENGHDVEGIRAVARALDGADNINATRIVTYWERVMLRYRAVLEQYGHAR